MDCPSQDVFACHSMKTSVASGPALDQLLTDCGALYDTASAAGVEFPVVKRTGFVRFVTWQRLLG